MLKDFIDFNPRETLPKGQPAKKVAMEKLRPFCRDIEEFEVAKYSGGTKFRNGDTLLARITPCLENGKTAQVRFLNDGEVGFGSTEYIVLRAKEGVSDSDYIYYLSTSPKFREIAIQSMVGSSGRQRVQQDVLEKAELHIPPLDEQKKIAGILSALDDKIELNNKINRNLEAQAQAIFKSWFIDFEPFKNGKFIDSELGKIPEGWKVGKLSDIANITMGQSPNGNSYNEKKIGMVFFQGRAEFGWRFPRNRLYTTAPKRIAERDSVLLSIRAPVGDINKALERCCIGRGLASLTSNHKTFLYYKMQSIRHLLDVYNGEGTVFGSINKNTLQEIRTIIPIDSEIIRFELKLKVVDELIRNNYIENLRLIKLRDTLLPELMSGKIDILRFSNR